MALKLSDPSGAQSGGFSPVAKDGTPYLWGSFATVPVLNRNDGQFFDATTTSYYIGPPSNTFTNLGKTLALDGGIIVGGDTDYERVFIGRCGLDSDAEELRIISSPLGTSYNGDFGHSVDAADNLCVIGAPRTSRDGGTTINQGRAYLYNQDGSQISQLSPSGSFTLPTSSGTANFYGWSVAMGEGIVAVGGRNYQNGFISLFNYQGTHLLDILGTDHSAGDRRFGNSLNLGDGKIVTVSGYNVGTYGGISGGDGKLHVFDFNGNQLWYKEYNYLTYGSTVACAVGSGRIAVCTTSTLLIYDYGGNLIAAVAKPSNIVSLGSNLKIGYGLIVVGCYDNTGSGAGAGALVLYDLDGNYLQNLELPSAYASGYEYFGDGVAIGNGILAAGGDQTYGFAHWVFDIKPTGHDVLKTLRKKDKA